MSSKQGYKIVLTPGDELLRVLDNSRPERREISNQAEASPVETSRNTLTAAQEEASDLLQKHGVAPAKGTQLLARYGPDNIVDTIEYLETQMKARKYKQVENPAGLIIYSLENALPVPASFPTTRRRRALEEVEITERAQSDARTGAKLAYSAGWRRR